MVALVHILNCDCVAAIRWSLFKDFIEQIIVIISRPGIVCSVKQNYCVLLPQRLLITIDYRISACFFVCAVAYFCDVCYAFAIRDNMQLLFR